MNLIDLFGDYDAACAGDTGTKTDAAMLVYRVEMPNGRGPYNSGLGAPDEIYDVICATKRGYDCARNASLNGEQMGVTEQAFFEARGDAEYACESIEAIRDWFPTPARRYLAKRWNARLHIYEVPCGGYVLKPGRGEVIFSRKDARPVKVVDLIDLQTELS